jgi:hypothetical protein
MRHMDAFTKLIRLTGAAAIALTLSAGPAVAAEDAPAEDVPAEGEEAVEDASGEEEGGRIQVADTPRDRVGLIVLGFFAAVAAGGAVTVSRQLKGARPQADGEFRWR